MPRGSRRKRIPRRTDIWPRAWRRRPLASAVLLVLVLLFTYVRVTTPAGPDHDRYHNRTFICVNVVDGDTLDINIPDGDHDRTRVRLWGVDTPETSKSPGGAMHYGEEASAFTKSFVLGKPARIVLAPDETRGKYGRLLAYVYLSEGETMLNEELIARGFGYADRRFPHVWRERFIQLEDRARKAAAGLWAEVTLDKMPAWRQRYEKWRTGEGRSSEAQQGTEVQ